MSSPEPRSTEAREWMGVFVVRGLAFLRVAQFVLWGWPVVAGIGEYSLVAPVAYVLLGGWSAVLFVMGHRAKRMTPALLVADVVAAVVAAIVVSRSYPLGDAASTHNGLIAPLVGTAVTVAVYGSRTGAAAGVLLVMAAWLIGTWPDLATPSATVAYSNEVVILVFAAVTRLNGQVLLGAAKQTDAAIDRALEAEQREAAAEGRDRERRRQFSQLHDTVLQTLENIARGVLDVHSEEAQRNCARDAEYLRGLITGSVADVPTDLGAMLALMMRNRPLTWGDLRVRQLFDKLPPDLPSEIAEAIVGAIREALNNVAKYAKVDEARVTGYGNDHGGVVITVVDQGVGFDPDAEKDPGKWGLSWSMRNRIVDIGGIIEIDSAPNEGTSVRVVWEP